MALSPTPAQRRVVAAADPGTGRLRGTEAQLAGLVGSPSGTRVRRTTTS